MFRILIVEDDKRLQEAISDYLLAKGLEIVAVSDGLQAMEQIENSAFDLLLLDIMIPNTDGFSLCQRVRLMNRVPIIFITARCSEEDQLYGYEMGADDYVIKPFSLAVLHAKCIALITRNKGADTSQIIEVGILKINLSTRKVTIEEKNLSMPPKEFDMLVYLLENKGIVITRDQLLNRIWGYDYYGDSRVVDTHIKKLRKVLGDYSYCIETVIKVGYRFRFPKE